MSARAIWKLPLEITRAQIVTMPGNAKVLHVGLDPAGMPCLWAMVEPEAGVKQNLHVHMLGTGWEVPETSADDQHLGSIVHQGFVWHFFAASRLL